MLGFRCEFGLNMDFPASISDFSNPRKAQLKLRIDILIWHFVHHTPVHLFGRGPWFI